jgi:hypothetical protein
MNIQIGIACGTNCEEYVKFLIFSIIKTTPNMNNIEFLLGINNKSVNVPFLENIFINNNLKYKIIKYDLKNNTSYPSSYNHALCLNEILKNMDKEYGMFIDCDVVLLEKNWNNKLLEMFKDNIAIIGSEYDGNKYMDFPNAVFCIFKTNILKKYNINFLPFHSFCPNYNKSKKNEIIQENKKYFNGDKEITLDVGWELPVKLKKNNYSGVTMKLVSPRIKETQKYLKFMLPDMRGESYQINNIPFCSHIGRSSSRSFNCDIVKMWRKRVLEWL